MFCLGRWNSEYLYSCAFTPLLPAQPLCPPHPFSLTLSPLSLTYTHMCNTKVYICCWVASVVSNSVWPHRRQPTRLLCPWDSPGKNTGVGCRFLLQKYRGAFLKVQFPGLTSGEPDSVCLGGGPGTTDLQSIPCVFGGHSVREPLTGDWICIFLCS